MGKQAGNRDAGGGLQLLQQTQESHSWPGEWQKGPLLAQVHVRSPELPSAIALSGEIQHWLKIAPSQLPAASINETHCVLDLLTLSTVQTGCRTIASC